MWDQKKPALLGLIVAIELLAGAILLLNFLSFTNTFANNSRWLVAKTQQHFIANDGLTFRDQTQALAKNALNLGAWRGFHEVYLAKPLAWTELSLKFLPSEDSYFYLIFHRTDQNFSALRINFSPIYQSALITAKYTGEFIEQIPIDIQETDGAGWQKLSLRKTNSASQDVEIWYNDRKLADYKTKTNPAGSIAFRSGRNELLVDDVLILDKQSRPLLSEKFDNYKKFWPNYLIVALVIATINFFVWIYLRQKPNIFKIAVRISFTMASLTIFVGCLSLLSSQIVRGRYPSEEAMLTRINILPKFESAEGSAWMQILNQELFAKYTLAATGSSQTKIMFIGSSQTLGEGSSLINEDFVSQFKNLVETNLTNSNKEYTIINTGRAGRTAKELVVYFKTQWLKLKPDLVIINLSGNDEEYHTEIEFAEALEEFIELSKIHNFKLVFIAEANNIESKPTLATHKIMKKMAQENQILFIDMHQLLAQHQQDGILWWDFIHPTSFGYKLIAQLLFEKLQSQL